MPTYSPTEGYAKSVLILHVPWKNKFNEQDASRDYVNEFKMFLKSGLCPMSVIIGYDRAKARYQKKEQFVEPTGKRRDIDYESFSTSVNDESVTEIVALASTLGHTSAYLEDNQYYYGTNLTIGVSNITKYEI